MIKSRKNIPIRAVFYVVILIFVIDTGLPYFLGYLLQSENTG